MTNASTLWGEIIIDELAAAGIDTICISPGSRSTPLVMAATAHTSITTYSILDERSNGFFALGRAKQTSKPVAVVSTSGTAAANFHPAVIEADRSHTPLVVCTADRPPEIQHNGANQTIIQDGLFASAIRWEPTIPSPRDDRRSMASLRSTISTGVAKARRPNPGPVHLNIPFRKPLAPIPDEVPLKNDTSVGTRPTFLLGDTTPTPSAIETVVSAITNAEKGLIIAGPSKPNETSEAIAELATLTGFAVIADSLSNVRFNTATDALVIGGYDGYISGESMNHIPDPELILQIGAAPTSVNLQQFVQSTESQLLRIDPFVEYRDPTFSTDYVIEASIGNMVPPVANLIGPPDVDSGWNQSIQEIEAKYWDIISNNLDILPPESRIAYEMLSDAPSGATVFVSNSMPIRDVDRFGRPRNRSLTLIGNRGASGIDGIVSSGLGAGSVDSNELILFVGDLALLHDSNGLQLVERAAVDATIIVINNDGGGIFSQLPIVNFDPPFTEQFRTPHGIDLGKLANVYDIDHHVTSPSEFSDHYTHCLGLDRTNILEVTIDVDENERKRDTFEQRIERRLVA